MVAENPSATRVSWGRGSHSWNATLNATKQQLKSAPEFDEPSLG